MKEEQQDINAVPENTDVDTEIVEEVNEEQTSSLEQESNHTAEIERLQAIADENQQRVLRTQADFDNYRKRTQKEKEEFAKYASTKLITELLPVMDNFERAFSTGVEDLNESFSKGMNMVFRQLEGVLQAEGLVPMESVGQPFNPEFHQAIMQVESEDYPEGTVVEEIQKGYLLKDKVLRPAMVKVSQ